jgi:hypothetical protein
VQWLGCETWCVRRRLGCWLAGADSGRFAGLPSGGLEDTDLDGVRYGDMKRNQHKFMPGETWQGRKQRLIAARQAAAS